MAEDEPQYKVVLKMVLWGEESEAIFRRLRVNGIEGDRATAIYAKARAERMRMIRGEGLKVFLMGLFFLAVAFGIFYFFRLDELDWEASGGGVLGMPFLPELLGFAVAISGLFGLWKFVQGAIEMLFAHLKSGSIVDD